MENNNHKVGRISAKVGDKFYKEIESIIDKRLLNGKSRDRISVERITNLIVRHKLWKNIFTDLTLINEEEIQQYGK